MAKLVSQVYGDALFEAAMEKNLMDEWFEEVGVLREVFAEHADLREFLQHPQITKTEKIHMLHSAFKGKLSGGLLNFLSIVMEKGRQSELLPMFTRFMERAKEYKKIGAVNVTSAVILSEEQKAQLENRLLEITPYVSLETAYTVDESLLGGLVIRIGDRLVDSSIRTQLDRMKRELMNK